MRSGEEADHVVFGGEEEAGLAGVALAAGTAAQLVVDAAGLVALGAADEEAAEFAHFLGLGLALRLQLGRLLGQRLLVALALVGDPLLFQLGDRQVLGVAAELDVDAAAGHVGGDHHRSLAARLGDQLALSFGVLGLRVQHRVFYPLPLQRLGDHLRDLDRDGSHQDRLALLVAADDFVEDGTPLAVFGLEDLVVLVGPDHRFVGRDLDHRHFVDLHELGRLGEGGAGHPGELVVEAEVVLEGDRRQGLVLLPDRHALLRLDRLVQALRPAPALEDAAGELVDDHHLAVDHRVVVVLLVERLCLQRLDEVVDEAAVLTEVEVVDADELLGFLHPALGRRHRLVLFVVLVVVLGVDGLARLAQRFQFLFRRHAHHLFGEAGEGVIGLGRLFGGAGDDQRRPRLVDEDVVDLVHDREVVVALDAVLERVGHVVAQVVEAELRVGPVGDVERVFALAGGVVVGVLERVDGDAERVVDRLHPVRVAAGQVVVDGDDVDAFAGERVEEDGQGGGQGLSLTGFHLGDAAVVEDHAADQLDVVVALTGAPLRGLSAERECLRQEVVERLAVAGALAQGVRLGADLLVGERFHLRLKPVYRLGALLVGLEFPSLSRAQRLRYEVHRWHWSRVAVPD